MNNSLVKKYFLIMINFESVNGKNDDFIDFTPIAPKMKKAKINTLTATGNFIK